MHRVPSNSEGHWHVGSAHVVTLLYGDVYPYMTWVVTDVEHTVEHLQYALIEALVMVNYVVNQTRGITLA